MGDFRHHFCVMVIYIYMVSVMKSPQNKPFLQLTGKLLVHQQKNKRLDKHDGNHISRPHKRPFSWLKVSDPFRTHPKTALGRGTRRRAPNGSSWHSYGACQPSCSACDPWPCATTGFLRNSGSSWVNFTRLSGVSCYPISRGVESR